MREGLSRLGLVLLFTVLCAPVFYGLGRLDLENDEAIYSYAVDSILATGDWLNPRSSPSPGTVFLEKPPLKFWIVAAPIRAGLLPHDEFGMRFWDAVMAVMALAYVVALGRRLRGWLCGVAALLLLLGYAPLWFDHGLRGNYMEAPLFLAYAAGAWHFLAWLDAADGSRRRRHAAAVGLAFVLGFLTKFVAAIFLPAVLGVTLLLTPAGPRRLREDARLWAAVAAGVLVLSAPWFVYQQRHAGAQLWRTMLGEHVVTRFTASLDPAHVQPWHYYLSTIAWHLNFRGVALLTLGGVGLLAAAAWRERNRDATLMLVWMTLPLAAISTGTSKLHHYAYPFLPPVALAAGAFLSWLIAAAGPVAAGWLDRARSGLRRPAPWTRPALAAILTIGVAAVVLAAQSLVYGQVTWRVHGVQVLRNSNVSPPLAVAALALVLLGVLPSRQTITLAVLLLLFGRWYEETLHRFGDSVHPLRSARECLSRVEEAHGARRPLLAVREAQWFHHPYFYYLAAPAGWQRVPDVAEPDVAAALQVPERAAPVAVGTEDASWLTARGLGRDAGVLRLENAVVLLPGPLRACAPSGDAR